MSFGGWAFFEENRIARHDAVQHAEKKSGRNGIFGFGLERRRLRRTRVSFSCRGVAANVFHRGSEIAHDAGSGERSRSVERRISDLEQLGSRLNRIAGPISVIKKNGRAQNHNRVMSGKLIGQRLLCGPEISTKEGMRSREGHSWRDRFLVDIDIEMFRKRDDFVPPSVFFNL